MRLANCFAALVILALALSTAMAAQQRRTGDFDYYVLALSWSPSYCEAAGNRADPMQCQTDRPFAFVVHGLWPQYERGWPQHCRLARPHKITRQQTNSILDLMPSRGLIRHEWRKHGTCSGLTPTRYLDQVRQAWSKIVVPDQFQDVSSYVTARPDQILAAFIAVNPELKPNHVTLTCDSRRLREVRICMTRDLRFRRCTDRRNICRKNRIVLPPVRSR